MYRTALSKMLFLARLVIIVSLAGYTLSNANAAMHGTAFPELTQSMSQSMHGGDHAQLSEHDHDGKTSTDDDSSDLSKQECCKDFCSGFAIICGAPDLRQRVAASTRHYLSDDTAFGEMPTLDRPPNI